MKLYPPYKEAALNISDKRGRFYAIADLEEMLDEKEETNEYRFAFMRLQGELLNTHDIDFIPTKSVNRGRGYKIATDEERVQITAKRLSNKVRNAARKQYKVLTTVKPGLLTKDTKVLYDRHFIRNGLLLAFLHQTPLSKCLHGAKLNIEKPKLIDVSE